MKQIYGKTRQFEPYINGNLYHDASIWFASHAKYDPNETGIEIMEKTLIRNTIWTLRWPALRRLGKIIFPLR